MKNKIKVDDREELLIAQGMSIMAMKMKEISKVITDGVLSNDGVDDYTKGSVKDNYDKIVADNELTPRQVFMLGSYWAAIALEERFHDEYRELVDENMIERLIKEVESKIDNLEDKKKVVIKAKSDTLNKAIESIERQLAKMDFLSDEESKDIRDILAEAKKLIKE